MFFSTVDHAMRWASLHYAKSNGHVTDDVTWPQKESWPHYLWGTISS